MWIAKVRYKSATYSQFSRLFIHNSQAKCLKTLRHRMPLDICCRCEECRHILQTLPQFWTSEARTAAAAKAMAICAADRGVSRHRESGMSERRRTESGRPIWCR